MALLGAAGQFGIFGALVLATLLGFDINEAVSIGIIGSADGPTSIYVTGALAPHLLGPVAVAAYSYMSLVPVLKPPVMRLLTTPAQRRIHMPYTSRPVSRLTRLLFPLVVTLIAGLLVPLSTPLISMLMFGNLLREAGVVERLNRAAQNELADVITIFLGLAVGATMTAGQFLQWRTLGILAMGAVAFILDTAGGVLAGQALRILTRNRFNPLIGAAGISAFPMSAGGAPAGPGRGPLQLFAHARHGRQHRRPDRVGDGRGWCWPCSPVGFRSPGSLTATRCKTRRWPGWG